MNIAAVVFFFNPVDIGIQKVINNVFTYSQNIERIYIVDNSDTDNHQIALAIPNSIYIRNYNNRGIAGALNKGCKRTVEDGSDWCMTLDQDSAFDKNNLILYFELSDNFIKKNPRVVSFGPDTIDLNTSTHWTKKIRFKILSPLKIKILGKHYKIKKNPDIIYPPNVITSANIISLFVWNKIGRGDESLFIDQVAIIFCRRLIAEKYLIVQFHKVFLKHSFGKKNKFTLLPKYTPHYGTFRLYYIFRNLFIEQRRFRQSKYQAYYKKMLRRYFWDNCINSIHILRNLKLFIRAYRDARVYLNKQQVTSNSNIIEIFRQAVSTNYYQSHVEAA